jgi:hypothetical protein
MKVGTVSSKWLQLTVHFSVEPFLCTRDQILSLKSVHNSHSHLFFFEKLIVTQLIKKFTPPFYGTRRFITAFTWYRHWCLSGSWWIQLKPSHYISVRVIFVLSFCLLLGLSNFNFFFRHKFYIDLSSLAYIMHASHVLFSVVWYPEYLVKSTHYGAPHYVIVSCLVSLLLMSQSSLRNPGLRHPECVF